MLLQNLKIFFETLFSFDSKYPLLFTQFYFWAFFAIVFAIFSLLRNKILLRNAYLFFVSLFFYYKTSGLFVLMLVFTVLYGYFIARRIDRLKSRGWRKFYMILGVVLNLSVLAYFKYAYFFTDVYNSLFHCNVEVVNYLARWTNEFIGRDYFDCSKILLPVGISFFTFQNISYIVDVYKNRIHHVGNILDFGFYLTFFPQLVSGPIVRAEQFIPQIHKKYFLSRKQFGIAVFWILNGLLKKIILSDYIAVNFVNRVFTNPLFFTGFENLMSLFVYSLQVYADFSGYTDMATGMAMLMGFYLPKNFDSPYKSANPGEFWKRWHISLSSWLKDYLYIPLGGNRKGNVRTGINIMITMLLGGLWHGASWNFAIWGGLNGIGILIYKRWRFITDGTKTMATLLLFAIMLMLDYLYDLPLFRIGIVWSGVIFVGTFIETIYCVFVGDRHSNHIGKVASWLSKAWNVFLTFIFISFTRLFFRSSSNLSPAEESVHAWRTAKEMVSMVGGQWHFEQIPQILYAHRFVFILFVTGMIIHWLPERWKRWYRLNFAMLPMWVMVLVAVLVVFVVYQFITAEVQPFVYFQF